MLVVSDSLNLFTGSFEPIIPNLTILTVGNIQTYGLKVLPKSTAFPSLQDTVPLLFLKTATRGGFLLDLCRPGL